MLALIMAGGKGTRLQMGEKGLVRLFEKPLIEYVLTAAEDAGLDPVVVTTRKTPYTANYCRVRGVDQICTEGAGYVEDITEAVTILGETGPFLIICADLPGIRGEHIEKIVSTYKNSNADACSVWIPVSRFEEQGCEVRFKQTINDVLAVPAGVNILLGSRICEVQNEICILIDDPALVFNVNTRSELSNAESFFCQGSVVGIPEIR